MIVLTLNQAAARWAPPVSGDGSLTEEALLDAIFAGAEAAGYTASSRRPGALWRRRVVQEGQAVFEYHEGVCTDRWVTVRAEGAPWCGWSWGREQAWTRPARRAPPRRSRPAMENVKDRDGPPGLGPALPRRHLAGRDGRSGRWLMFPSIVQAG